MVPFQSAYLMVNCGARALRASCRSIVSVTAWSKASILIESMTKLPEEKKITR